MNERKEATPPTVPDEISWVVKNWASLPEAQRRRMTRVALGAKERKTISEELSGVNLAVEEWVTHAYGNEEKEKRVVETVLQETGPIGLYRFLKGLCQKRRLSVKEDPADKTSARFKLGLDIPQATALSLLPEMADAVLCLAGEPIFSAVPTRMSLVDPSRRYSINLLVNGGKIDIRPPLLQDFELYPLTGRWRDATETVCGIRKAFIEGAYRLDACLVVEGHGGFYNYHGVEIRTDPSCTLMTRAEIFPTRDSPAQGWRIEPSSANLGKIVCSRESPTDSFKTGAEASSQTARLVEVEVSLQAVRLIELSASTKEKKRTIKNNERS